MDWNRLTPSAFSAVTAAKQEAGRLGQKAVAGEHLLLAMLGKEAAVAVKVLDGMGLSRESVISAVRSQAPSAEPATEAATRLSPDGRQVLELAGEEATKLSDAYIGTEHLLLGILDSSESVAGKVLAGLGADAQKARSVIQQLINGSA
ncbi:MAG TPA: Clp protease N-terminal domain-containing protein [Chthonomonadales bacterium]|nr:Clp protease N-terminal domain-containing protein [Chthonomonadales bacterium]